MIDELPLPIDHSRTTVAQTQSTQSMRTFVQNEILPMDAAFRGGGLTSDQVRELTQAVAEFGLPGGAVPKEFGGLGMGRTTQALLFEELVRGSVQLAGIVLVNMLAASLLLRRPALRERYLHDLITGRAIAGLGIEPTQVRSATALRAARTPRGFVIEGTGEGIESCEWSDFLVCAVRVADEGDGYFLLDRAQHRYETRIAKETNERAPAAHRVVVAEAHLERSNYIGPACGDSNTTRHLLDESKLHEGVASVAQAQDILDVAVAHAVRHMQFGRPLAAQNLVAMQIAEMAALIESARLMCQRGFALLDTGRSCEKESAMARWYASNAAMRVRRRAMRIVPGCDPQHDEAPRRDFEAGMRLATGGWQSDAQLIARAVTGVKGA